MAIQIFSLTKNKIFFEHLRELFEQEDIFFSGMSENPQTAITDFQNCTPRASVVLLSANWPYGSQKKAPDLMNDFRALPDPPKIILVTNMCEPKMLRDYEQFNPDGYFFQCVGTIQPIANCIKRVHEGETFFCLK